MKPLVHLYLIKDIPLNVPRLLLALMVCAACTAARAQDAISLIDRTKAGGGWKFDNGREFPGATGSLEVSEERFREQPVLDLHGNFTKGGNYVQAAISLPEIPIETLSFWANLPPGADSLPMRLVDGTGQCHQIRLKMNDKGGWQHIVLPVDRFFRTMGTAAAMDLAKQYQYWSGAKDGRWHQPGRLLVILYSKNLGLNDRIRFADVQLVSQPPVTKIEKTVPLDSMLQAGEIDWTFNLGQEFKGAQGGLAVVADQPAPGSHALRLHADFTEGGAYVGMHKSFADLNVKATPVIRFKVRSESTKQFAIRLVDQTGQCHQRKSIAVTADGKWHDLEIHPTKIAGGEHWGGANDGTWHGPVSKIELMLNTRSHPDKTPELLIADIRADVVIEASAQPASYRESFDAAENKLPQSWQVAGDVQVVSPGLGDAGSALQLRRTLETIETPTSAVSAPFSVSPGAWQVQYDWKSELFSPDNSYHGLVMLETLDPTGKPVESFPLGIGFGNQDWQHLAKSISLPGAATQARVKVQLNKTYGSFWLDGLSVARLSVQPIEQRIARILLKTDATGNLFLPGDPVAFRIEVEASKPLPTAQQTLSYTVRDYWGAEQTAGGQVALQRRKQESGYVYQGEIQLPDQALAVGKFYELHVATSPQFGDPIEEFSGFAVLPEAESKQHAPEAIPFTIRNWDSRIGSYFHLADRLGLRLFGVWGGWSSKPPYKPHLPGVDTVAQLQGKWVTGTPASQVERNGFKDYTQESLRQGMKNFLEAFADRGLAMIAMGNEPHGTGQKVRDNVQAYRAVYETVKAFDPEIHVIGTSVEPNEEYFKAGYQNYLDSYDFHVYEHYTKVRTQMAEYRALMQKYDAVKPIHSTELGLNSQGQTRLAAARELIKKFVVFFADGGDTVSWFTIHYPDPKGTARGQFGDSHCVFDCKYNLFNPRLDAVTYYHVINGITNKKFADEQQYPGGVQAFLFRDSDDRCLQVLWADGKREDVLVPLPDGAEVELTRIDGSSQMLQATKAGVTVTVSEDPVLLRYKSNAKQLPKTLQAPTFTLVVDPTEDAEAVTVPPGKQVTVALTGAVLTPATLRVKVPFGWKADVRPAEANRVRVTLTAPSTTTATQVSVLTQHVVEGTVTGEIMIPIEVK